MGMSEANWEEAKYCPKCKEYTDFFMCQFDDLDGLVTDGICSICETEMTYETNWVKTQ